MMLEEAVEGWLEVAGDREVLSAEKQFVELSLSVPVHSNRDYQKP